MMFFCKTLFNSLLMMQLHFTMAEVCLLEVTYIREEITTEKMPRIESQSERKADCDATMDRGSLDIYPCHEGGFSNSPEAINNTCILCGRDLQTSSLTALCSTERDDPARHVKCDYCEKKVKPCLNNGEGYCPSANLTAVSFKCKCPKGFNGTLCENRIIQKQVTETLPCNCSPEITQGRLPRCDSSGLPCYTSYTTEHNNTYGCSCPSQTKEKKIKDKCSSLLSLPTNDPMTGSSANQCVSREPILVGLILSLMLLGV